MFPLGPADPDHAMLLLQKKMMLMEVKLQKQQRLLENLRYAYLRLSLLGDSRWFGSAKKETPITISGFRPAVCENC